MDFLLLKISLLIDFLLLKISLLMDFLLLKLFLLIIFPLFKFSRLKDVFSLFQFFLKEFLLFILLFFNFVFSPEQLISVLEFLLKNKLFITKDFAFNILVLD